MPALLLQYVTLPHSAAGLSAELERLERELRAAESPRGRRLLSIERRRALLALDRIEPADRHIAALEDEGQ